MERKTLVDLHSSAQLFMLLAVVYALVYMTKNCYSAAMASIVNEGIMTKSETGLISAAFYLVYAIFQVFGGFAADKYSPLKLLIIGIVGAAISNLLIFFVDGYTEMIIIWSFNAAIQFGVWPAIFKIVTTQLAEATRVKYMLYISMSSTFGLLASYICAMFIKNWKNNFLLSAIVLFVSAIVMYFGYKKIEKKMVFLEPVEGKNEVKPTTEVNFLPIMLKAGIPMLLIVSVIYSVLSLGLKSLAPVMLMESYESITPTIANGLNLFLVAAYPIGVMLAKSKAFVRFNFVTTVTILLALSIPLLVVVAFIGKTPVAFVVASLVLVMVFVAAIAQYFSYISMAFNKFGRTGTLSGIFNATAALGIVIANYGFAKMADLFGWGITTKACVAITAFALILSLVTIPLWKNFIKDVEKMR